MTSFELKKKLLPVLGSCPLWFVLMQTSQCSHAVSAITTANVGQDLLGSSGPGPIISAAPSTLYTCWNLSLFLAPKPFRAACPEQPACNRQTSATSYSDSPSTPAAAIAALQIIQPSIIETARYRNIRKKPSITPFLSSAKDPCA